MWRSVAGHGVSVYCRGVPDAFVVRVFWWSVGASPGRFRAVLAVSGPLHIRRVPAHGLVALAWLSIRCGGVCVLSSFFPPSSPYSGKQGPLLNSFLH